MEPLNPRLRFCFLTIVLTSYLILVGCTPRLGGSSSSGNNTTPPVSIPNASTPPPVTEPNPDIPLVQLYSYQIVHTYPHDPDAFTEGLVFQEGFLYESTGLYGQSSLRKVDLKTGKVIMQRDLSPDIFGEGIAVYGNNILQLTWKNGKGFVYDKATFLPQGEFNIDTEGWGITTDGKHLIMSDGTSTLHILSPQTYEDIGEIQVSDNGSPVNNLNELEYIGGLIYANVWKTDKIAIIDPGSGRVNAWVDLTGLLPSQTMPVDVLNGIAYDADTGRIFVTGKLWPALFEIQLVRTN